LRTNGFIAFQFEAIKRKLDEFGVSVRMLQSTHLRHNDGLKLHRRRLLPTPLLIAVEVVIGETGLI
jgi:hypothetical protein